MGKFTYKETTILIGMWFVIGVEVGWIIWGWHE